MSSGMDSKNFTGEAVASPQATRTERICGNCGLPLVQTETEEACRELDKVAARLEAKRAAQPAAGTTPAEHIKLSRMGLRLVGDQLDRIPIKNAQGWNRYNTDTQRVLHIWADDKSYDIAVPKEEFLGDE